ncbi:MAG: hypothetical protein IJ019_01765 [Alphaproteobacteria bacterium]|nr:hypothetical protein [Alphaproteobacteria bacterium]
MKKFILTLLCLVGMSSTVYATVCVVDSGETESCTPSSQTAIDCEKLGYFNTDVDGCTKYLYCPYNQNYKKCVAGNVVSCEALGFTNIEFDSSCSKIVTCPSDENFKLCAVVCDYKDKQTCETTYTNFECREDAYTCFSPTNCKTGYCKSGTACYNVCDGSVYKYSQNNKPANISSLTGSCTGYVGTSGGDCSGSQVTVYSGFNCSSGYCKTTDECAKICDPDVYKYYIGSPDLPEYASTNESSEKCTGYYSTSGKDCAGSLTTKYSGFNCEDGYQKNAAGTGCERACTYDSELACTSANPGSVCSDSSGCYEPSGCTAGYCSLNGTCKQLCNPSLYQYTSNNTDPNLLTGEHCEGYIDTVDGGTCSGESLKRYKDYSCPAGYKKGIVGGLNYCVEDPDYVGDCSSCTGGVINSCPTGAGSCYSCKYPYQTLTFKCLQSCQSGYTLSSDKKTCTKKSVWG